MFDVGSDIDRAIEKLAAAVAEDSDGKVQLGTISGVLSELLCRIDVFCAVVTKQKRGQPAKRIGKPVT
jgi:hypothetical protein